MGLSLLQSLFLLASARQAVASCAHGTFLSPRAEDGSVKVNTFGYSGEIGPLNWHALAAENTACNTGTQQSPISMVTGTFNMVPASDLLIDIPDFAEGTEFENLGTTVEVIAKGGTLAFGTKSFDLQQFHFHLPSEHLDNGTSQAMEMHMVFQSAAQEIAVIGMYIEIATDNTPSVVQAPGTNITRRAPPQRRKNENSRRQVVPSTGPTALLESVLSQVGQIATPGTKVATGPVVMSEIVNILQSGSFQGYMGSLTTPPCSEGVNWLVSTARLAVTPGTFNAVRDVIGFNSRFPQNTPGQPNLLALSSQAAPGAASLADVVA